MICGETFLRNGMCVEKKDLLELGKQRAAELGLEFTTNINCPNCVTIWRLLGEGVELFSRDDRLGFTLLEMNNTHMSYSVGRRPIKAESEERKLLRELALYQDWQHTKGKTSLYELIDRAKKLLEESK